MKSLSQLIESLTQQIKLTSTIKKHLQTLQKLSVEYNGGEFEPGGISLKTLRMLDEVGIIDLNETYVGRGRTLRKANIVKVNPDIIKLYLN